MAICKFWQQGNCRFGDNCRFEHPSNSRGAPNGNRFAPLQNNPGLGLNPRNNNSYSQNAPSITLPYGLDKGAILTDLTTEQPQWILSAYGPGRAAPAQLFGGAREQSFEEMRLLHYISMAAGNPQQAAQEAEKLFQLAQQQMQTAANNVDAAIEFIINGEKEHPNRIDIVNQTVGPQPGSQTNPFSQNASPFPSTPTVNPFGAPSQPSATTTVFGAPSGSFGQPSTLGPKPNPFASSNQGSATPTQFGSSGAFGQPSTLGQKPNPFGASSTASPFSAFANQPAAFSQQPIASSAFGTPSQPAQPTNISQASLQPSNPFSTQSIQPPTSLSNPVSQPFGLPSPASQNTFGASSHSQAAGPFASTQPSTIQPMNPFAKISSPLNQSPFATANAIPAVNPFGSTQQAVAPNPFTRSQTTTATDTNPFGQSQAMALSSTSSNQFTASSLPTQSFANGTASEPKELGTPHPHIGTYSTRDRGGILLSFKNKPVIYKDNKAGVQRPDGSWERIMFPDGPPQPNKDAAMSAEHYANNQSLKSEYSYASQHGTFKDGKLPLVPPLVEWCSFDF